MLISSRWDVLSNADSCDRCSSYRGTEATGIELRLASGATVSNGFVDAPTSRRSEEPYLVCALAYVFTTSRNTQLVNDPQYTGNSKVTGLPSAGVCLLVIYHTYLVYPAFPSRPGRILFKIRTRRVQDRKAFYPA